MNANKQIISNILLLTSIAIYNIKSELDELKTESSHSFYIIKSLESDLSILKSIHTILQSHIANSLENKLKDVVWSDFLCIDGDFTLDTFDRPLSENELIDLANYFGLKYYTISEDIGAYITNFTNDEEG